MDEIQITVYVGIDNPNIHEIILAILNKMPENLYQIKKLPTDETRQRAMLTEMRKMRTELSKYKIKDKWDAKNLIKTPILTINDNTYPWWYIEQEPTEILKQLSDAQDKYMNKLEQNDNVEEKYDETKGIILTEDKHTWVKTEAKKVKKLMKTPGKLYKEINSWDEDVRAGFMVGWNATNHDTIPDKLRKIAYELERNDVQNAGSASMDSVGPTK